MDFSDLFEGWDVSQFLSADELSLLNVVEHPASPSPPSYTGTSARQGSGSLEAQLSPAALPSIPSPAGLPTNTPTPTSNRGANFFQQPRPSMPQPLRAPQQCPSRPPPPAFALQDHRLRPRPPFAHVRPVPPPQRLLQRCPVQRPAAPPIFRTPSPTTSRFVAPPAGHALFAARPTAPPARFPYQSAQSAPVYPAHTAPLSSAASQRLSLADYRREKNRLQHPGVSSTPSSSDASKKNSAEQEEGEIESNETDESDQDEEPTSSASVAMASLDECTKLTEPVTRQELVKRGLSVHFVPLPEGWVEIQHQSGMPVYCHLASRAVTWSRPYVCDKQERFRSQKAPISAFPCWDYQRTLDEEMESQPEPVSTANQGMIEPEGFAEILSGLEFKEKSMMSADQIAKYCSQRFEFTTVTSSPAKSSRVKRASREALTQQLATTQAIVEKGLMVAFRRGETRFVLNAANRNPIALLQDFTFQNKKNQRISYECGPSLESNLLFHTDVLIAEKVEGSADGMSKKAAKQAAALDALRKLVPEIQHVLDETFAGAKKSGQIDEMAFFRDVPISDPRIGDTAVKAGVLPPYQILLRAVGNTDHDNVSLADKTKVCLSTRQIGPNQNEYTCVAGPYSASVVHTSLVRAKQLCAQQILQEIHPELATYGEFLELYGSAFQEKKKRLRQDAKCLYKMPPGPVVDEIDWPRIIQLQEEMRKLIPETPGALSSLRYV